MELGPLGLQFSQLVASIWIVLFLVSCTMYVGLQLGGIPARETTAYVKGVSLNS